MKQVKVIEAKNHLYEPEALTIEVDGEPVEVLGHWRRYRDGGTSVVETSAGRLHSPAPRKSSSTKLNNEEVEIDWQVIN
jgi:hypothetical protein